MKRIVFVFMVALAACTHVDAGHVGVEVDSCEDGGIKKDPVGVGYHGVGPCVSIIEYPTYQQTLVLTNQEGEGSANDDAITVTSVEGLPISVDLSMSFTVDPAKVPHIYGKFKLDLSHIMWSYMRQSIREALQETFAKYTAQQLYSDKREIARAEVQKLLTDKFQTDGFLVTQFTVNQTRVPKEIEAAINGKVAMVQQAQQAEQAVKKTEAEGRQKVAVATAEAESLKVRAESEAAAIKIRADAQAYANKALAASVSRELIEYNRAQKWDGVMPKVTGGSGVILGADALK